jgi:DNA processing protein
MDKFKKDLILLNMLPDVGFIRLKALLDEFKRPEAVFNASLGELQRLKGIGKNIAESIKAARRTWDIDKELKLIEKEAIEIITIFDKEYPANLKNIYDPPFLLYIKGELEKEDDLAVAIVGSRRCSQYGMRMAGKLAGELAACGVRVISGMARGIDTAAHKGALKAGGRTMAVLGNGLSFTYPPENKNLADEITKNGALISEFPMQMPAHKQNFPRRNRVISGLTKGVVVVEAAEKSGSLITANFALEEGREVFAVPGAAGSITSKGTNNLIKQGAKLIEDAGDILDELNIPFKREGKEVQLESGFGKDIYGMLSDKPCDLDTIADAFSVKPKQAQALLLELEIRGIIRQLPGKLYVRAR